jgi:Leucine-rich repeat (LRR) protein
MDALAVDCLGKFIDLKRIDISDNDIRKLPDDLSALRHISEFNISGNSLDDLERAIEALKTMPRLQVL